MLGAQIFGVKPVELKKFLIVAEALVQQKKMRTSHQTSTALLNSALSHFAEQQLTSCGVFHFCQCNTRAIRRIISYSISQITNQSSQYQNKRQLVWSDSDLVNFFIGEN